MEGRPLARTEGGKHTLWMDGGGNIYWTPTESQHRCKGWERLPRASCQMTGVCLDISAAQRGLLLRGADDAEAGRPLLVQIGSGKAPLSRYATCE